MLLEPHRIVGFLKPVKRNILRVTQGHTNCTRQLLTRSISCFPRPKTAILFQVKKFSSATQIQSGQNFDQEHDSNSSGDRQKLKLSVSGVLIAAIVYSVYKTLTERFTVQAAKPVVCDENKYDEIYGRPTSDSKCDPQKKISKRAQFNFVADVVASAVTAVVRIDIKDHTIVDWFNGSPSTSNSGSGFIIEEDGLIITNAHVVSRGGRSSISVQLHDGRTFHGKVEAVDPHTDLALIRIPARGLPTLRLGNSSETRTGEFVCAIGSPLSLSHSVTAGIVSSVKRGASELGIKNDVSYIQTDATITYGNSGGPLVNLDGEAIGINAMKVDTGISFAIPSDYVKQFLAKVDAQKKSGMKPSQRRYVGVSLVTLSDDIPVQIGRETYNRGVLVWKVVVGSPAFIAGLMPGDIILQVNSKNVMSAKDVYDALEVSPNLEISYKRRGSQFRCIVYPEDIAI